ncbi:cag pathogenicity island protein, partial [Helicobacter pylori]
KKNARNYSRLKRKSF